MSDLNNTDVVTDVDTDVGTIENEWTPPTKEEWDDLLARKSRADAEAATRKRWLVGLGYNPKTGEKAPDAVVSGSDATDTAGLDTNSAKPVQVDTAAIEKVATESATALIIGLVDAGVEAKSLDLVVKLIDPAEDLSSQLEVLKTKAPGLFKRSRTTGAVADATAVGAGKKSTPSAASQERDWKDVMRERFNKGQI